MDEPVKTVHIRHELGEFVFNVEVPEDLAEVAQLEVSFDLTYSDEGLVRRAIASVGGLARFDRPPARASYLFGNHRGPISEGVRPTITLPSPPKQPDPPNPLAEKLLAEHEALKAETEAAS